MRGPGLCAATARHAGKEADRGLSVLLRTLTDLSAGDYGPTATAAIEKTPQNLPRHHAQDHSAASACAASVSAYRIAQGEASMRR